jgi:predicted RNA methylase
MKTASSGWGCKAGRLPALAPRPRTTLICSRSSAAGSCCPPLHACAQACAHSHTLCHRQDSERNEAYRRGIEATVEEDDLVVDIGTGSGLLALMAANAGAQHVFAIEGDPSLERAARKVIAANGKAETVTVVGRHSTQVKIGFGSDVPTGADVIVTEIFDR